MNDSGSLSTQLSVGVSREDLAIVLGVISGHIGSLTARLAEAERRLGIETDRDLSQPRQLRTEADGERERQMESDAYRVSEAILEAVARLLELTQPSDAPR